MVELVWDAGRAGTATMSSGVTAMVGDDAAFSPDDLLATAVSSCLMRTFLQLAAQMNIPVLSYAATAEVTPSDSGSPHVCLRSYVVAPSEANLARVMGALRQASRTAPICQLLGDRLTCQCDVKILGHSRAR